MKNVHFKHHVMPLKVLLDILLEKRAKDQNQNLPGFKQVHACLCITLSSNRRECGYKYHYTGQPGLFF